MDNTSLKPIRRIIIGETCGQCAGNIGDEGILAAMLPYFNRIFNGACMKVISYNCELVERMHGLKAVPIMQLDMQIDIKLLWEILRADFVVIGGGTLIQEQPQYKGFIRIGLGMLDTVSYVTAFAKIIARKPVMLIGIGVEPIKTKIGKWCVKHLIGTADMITVRDPESRKLLVDLGVNDQKVKLAADPAFLLEPVNDVQAKILLENCCLTKPGKYKVGVSLACERRIRPEHLQVIAQICDYMIECYNVDVIFVNMETRDGFDELAIKYTMERMKNRANMLTRYLYNPKEMLGIIKEFDMVIGTRMHFLIFAAAVNVPLVIISRSNKMDNFAYLLNQVPAGWTHDIKFETVKESIDYTWNNREEIREKLKPKVDILKEKALLNFHYLNEILKEYK